MDPFTGAWCCHSKCDRGGSLADLEMELSGDTLHRLLLHEITTKKAMAGGLIKVRGPAWKLSPLLGVIQAGREFYPQALQKHGLGR